MDSDDVQELGELEGEHELEPATSFSQCSDGSTNMQSDSGEDSLESDGSLSDLNSDIEVAGW